MIYLCLGQPVFGLESETQAAAAKKEDGNTVPLYDAEGCLRLGLMAGGLGGLGLPEEFRSIEKYPIFKDSGPKKHRN